MTIKKSKKPFKKPVAKPVVRPAKKENQEVMVFDVLQKEMLVAEYRNETVQWFGTKMYKVYHPAFTETPDFHRLVFVIGRSLGPLPEGAPLTQAPVLDVNEAMKEVTA